MVQYDLKTMRVFCWLVAEDPNVKAAVFQALKSRLDPKTPNVPEVSEKSIQEDALTAGALAKLVLDNSLIIDQLSDIVAGLASNLKRQRDLQSQQN